MATAVAATATPEITARANVIHYRPYNNTIALSCPLCRLSEIVLVGVATVAAGAASVCSGPIGFYGIRQIFFVIRLGILLPSFIIVIAIIMLFILLVCVTHRRTLYYNIIIIVLLLY